MAKPIKILFLAANPKDTNPLRLDEEIRGIDQALRQADFRDRFDIEQHWAVRVTDLQNYFLRYKPDLVHFSGHGSASREIILEDNDGISHPVSNRALTQLFSILKDNIRCVALNACYTEQQAQAIAKSIDCVIGMSKAIGDSATISFSVAFYQALGFGRDIKTAFDLGCLQIDLERLGEQDTPKLVALNSDPHKIVLVNTPLASKNSKSGDIKEVNKRFIQNRRLSYNSSLAKWWKRISATAVVIAILAGIAEFTGYSLKDIFSSSSIPSNTVTVLVHGEKGKDELVLPNRGIVKLIYGDAIISEQINNEGEATFKQVSEHFFRVDARVEILFQDPQGEPYRAMHHDSLYQLTKGKYIALPVKLYGLGQIRGIVKDFETGNPIEGARISVQGEVMFSNQYGEYTLSIPTEKQRQLQSVRAFMEGYHSFELDSVAVQTGREIPILMKPKRQ